MWLSPSCLPGPDERLRIWELHLPPGHGVDRRFLEEVATRCELIGGQRRNAVQFAALLSLDDGRRLSRCHRTAAIRREYRKAGALSPLQDGKGSRTKRG